MVINSSSARVSSRPIKHEMDRQTDNAMCGGDANFIAAYEAQSLARCGRQRRTSSLA